MALTSGQSSDRLGVAPSVFQRGKPPNIWVFLNGVTFETYHHLTYLDGTQPIKQYLRFEEAGRYGDEIKLKAYVDKIYHVVLTLIDKGAGIYRWEYAITNKLSAKMRLRLESSIRGTNLRTSNVATNYKSSDFIKNENTDLMFFQGSLIHKGKAVVALVPGNGFDNRWCLNPENDARKRNYPKNWFNTRVSEKKHSPDRKDEDGVFVTYGQLADGSENDFSVIIDSNKTHTLTMAVGIGRLASEDPRGVQKFLQDTYHDAFSLTPRKGYEKAMWATAHQLMRIKRSVLEKKVFLSVPPNNSAYAPDFYWEDGAEEVIGLDEPKWVKEMIRSELAYNENTGDTDFGGHMQPEDHMDGDHRVIVAWLIAFAKLRWNVQPSQKTIDVLAERADNYAIDAGELLPCRFAHFKLYYGGVEFGRSSEGLQCWTEEKGGADITQVDFRSGVQPPRCSKSGKQLDPFLKMEGSAATHSAYAVPLLTVVPGGASITVTMQVYLQGSFKSSGGIRIRMHESDAEEKGHPKNPTVSYSPWHSAATGGKWITLTYKKTISAKTNFIQAGPEVKGVGVGYAADIHVRFTESTDYEREYSGLHYGLRWTPDTQRCDVLGPMQAVQTSRRLGLRCCKEIIGKRWTKVHEDALRGLEGVYPKKFWNPRRVSSTLRHLAWEFSDFLPLSFGRLVPAC